MAATGPAPYIVDHKRGEVNELKALLNNPKFFKDADKRREILKKVIAYMTLGIDVSKLFSEMVMAASTKDLVQKKMVYHYLCNYAEQKSDLALLAINTLQKDSRDEDPMVRGLALRSLTSLRLPNLNEYVLLPLRQLLNDQSPYVRRTAVIGIAKLYQYAAESVRNSDLIDILYNMLKDRDCSVIQSSLNVLQEILQAEGGMAINSQIILYLLNRIKEFNEWGQCTVLDLVCKYKPASESEMFDIMNLLEDRLKHSNSAVVFGTTKVFLLFTADNPTVHLEVYKRLKAPLLTLMGGGSHELAYSVLAHIALLVKRSPAIFADSYKHFFCRFNDPAPVKQFKLQIITELVNEKNLTDILTELSEYVTDIDSSISGLSIQSIGRIAIQLSAAADESIEHLLSFLDLNIDYVSTESVIVMKDLLRKYPERYEDIIPSIQKSFRSLLVDNDNDSNSNSSTSSSIDGRVSVIWMIGEYGDTIDDAPYILESLIKSIGDESSSAVKLELLTATMKLFFKRPPEVQSMLGRLFAATITDNSRVDVRDRALLYYRLLQSDVHEAARIVNCPKVIVDVFAETDSDLSAIATVFREFNSLSVIYNKPAEQFIKRLDEAEKRRLEAEEKAAAAAVQSSTATSQILSEQDQETANLDQTGAGSVSGSSNTGNGAAAPATASAAANRNQLDLLADFGFDSGPSSNKSTAQSPSAPTRPAIELIPNITLDKQTYATKWGSLPVATVFELGLRSGAIISAPIESALSIEGILTFASGTVGSTIKLYLFARSNYPTEALFLVEAIIDVNSGKLRATVKSEGADQSSVGNFENVFLSALGPLL